MPTEHIHPIFDRLLSRAEREQRLGQRARVLWFTGLSGSGKSTIAQGLERKLFAEGFFPQVLDGDNIRTGINNNLGFSLADREENIRRIAEVAKLYVHSGVIAITSFISPTRSIRQMAAEVIGEADFTEIFIDTPLEICEARDVKGLYAKAREGVIKGFTGIDSPYEAPEDPFLRVPTADLSVEAAVELVYEHIRPLLAISS
ncbi:MAG: adenylyl-sulfate kinase [Lewinella sp.]|nr:adenylyl-sulfate kinase [Lewinella sp.]